MIKKIEKLMKNIKLELLNIQVAQLDPEIQNAAEKITVQYLTDLENALKDLQK